MTIETSFAQEYFLINYRQKRKQNSTKYKNIKLCTFRINTRVSRSFRSQVVIDVKVVWPPKTYWIFDKAFLAIAKYINSNAKTRQLSLKKKPQTRKN